MLVSSSLFSAAFAIGDAAPRFQAFVPPNNVSNRDVSLSVTAVSAGQTAVIIDDDGADGDTDDSISVLLERGETYVLYPREGAVNDDAGGKQDGDYFTITADRPVTALVATDSNWQHDWAPSDGRSSRGTSFLLWSPATSGQPADLNVYAYAPGTRVTIEDVTVAPTVSSGVTSVDLDNGVTVLDTVLAEGEDLHRIHGLGVDLFEEGHTYWVRASEPVTVQAGHLDTLNGANQARDGGGFVPGASGGAMADRYYVSIPHNPGRASEKELRAVAWEDYAEVHLFGWSPTAEVWNRIDVVGLDAWQTADWVGASDPTFASYDLYRVDVPGGSGVVLFEANWMETGSPGTSDYMSSVTSSEGQGSGTDFVAYLGPPGDQSRWAGGTYTRISVYAAEAPTDVRVLDLGTNGGVHFEEAVIPAGGYHDFLVDTATWNALNDPSDGKRPYMLVRSAEPVSVTVGNYNDNFMAWLTSPLSPEPRVTLTVNTDTLTCGATTTARIDIANSLGSTLTNGVLDLGLPEGVSATTLAAPGHGALTTTDAGVRWTAPDLPPGGAQSLDVQLTYDCASLATCPPDGLSTLTALRSGEVAGERYATNASQALELRRGNADAASPLEAVWNEGIGATELSWTVSEPTAGTRWTLSRSTSPDGPWTTLEVAVSDGSQTTYLTTDGTVNEGQTVFYRAVVTDTLGCERTLGPERVAVASTPSGGSGSGLESNGRLAHALARRAVADTRGWDPKREPAGFRSTGLEAWFVDRGPGDTHPIDATPWDLPAVTNAERAEARDYLTTAGEHVASVLVVQTVDAPYEHTKALCDRAGGATLEQVVDSPLTPDASVVRAGLRSSAGTYDWSTTVVVVDPPDGPPTAMSGWWVSTLPPQPEGTVFTMVTSWSSRPGWDLALLEDVLGKRGIEEVTSLGEAPTSWVRSVDTLGGWVNATLGGDPDVDVELATRDERGNWSRSRPLADDGQLAVTRSPFLEATLTVRDGDGAVLDHVWTSDGAWAAFDDGIWSGTSETTAFDGLCSKGAEVVRPEGLALSGCATARADVGDGGFAGVARHLAHPIDPRNAVSVWLRANRQAKLCIHGDDGVRPCATLPADPNGRWVHVDLTSTTPALTEARLVEVFTEGAGDSEVEVRGLTFREDVPAGAVRTTDTPVGPSPEERRAQQACGCTNPGPSHVGWVFLLAVGGILRRRPTAPQA